MRISSKSVAFATLVIMFGFGLGRAAKFRFQDQENQTREAFRKQLEASGSTRDAMKSKYPTPEIHGIGNNCIAPGGSGEVLVRGKFAPGTKFILQNDNLEILKESLTGGEYRATVKAAPGGPQTAGVIAITPMTGLTVSRPDAVRVSARFEWNLKAQNGWEVIARSPAGAGCSSQSERGRYEITFAKAPGAAPFQKLEGTLHTSVWDDYRFSVTQPIPGLPGGGASPQQEMQELAKQMMDPNLSDAKREEVMKRLQQVQQRMVAAMEKMTDPANIAATQASLQKQADEFGCDTISLKVQGSGVTGEMRCSEKLGRRIPVTGTLKELAR